LNNKIKTSVKLMDLLFCVSSIPVSGREFPSLLVGENSHPY